MNQKVEDLLNLALETSPTMRMQTQNLNTGFNVSSGTWELIVKYNGTLDSLLEYSITIEYLIAGYAILQVPTTQIQFVLSLANIEYVEMPKKLYFSDVIAQASAGILPVTKREPFLTGEGTYIAVIDSGIDYLLPEFQDSNGKSRISALWDQSLTIDTDNPPPMGFSTGRLYTKEMINQAIASSSPYAVVPSQDTSGHGTAVASVAASSLVNNTLETTSYEGIAVGCELLIVKLGNRDQSSFPRTTELMRALTFVVKYAATQNKPLAINLSFGNSYGAHNGTSLLERFIDNIAEIGRTIICVGVGNEGVSSGHYAGKLEKNVIQIKEVEITVADFETTLNVQLWKDFSDEFLVWLRAPSGERLLLTQNRYGKIEGVLSNTTILGYYGMPTPYATSQELYVEWIPRGDYIGSGIWKIEIEAKHIKNGNFYMFLPNSVTRSTNTRFVRPTKEMTLTIPSTASKIIAVGAYDMQLDAYAEFSGRGYRYDNQADIDINYTGIVRPTLVAPGVNLLVVTPGGSYTMVSGTSFSTPMVTGSAALLMEWGIVRGNDPFLYGEKVKAVLIKGAEKLPGEDMFSLNKVGYGKLDLFNTFENIRRL
ncbi:MAG: S8 family peptidase [Lachnospiraceae bacterium]